MTSAFASLDTSLWTTVAMWSIVPNIASSVLHNIFYSVRYPDPNTRPKQGDERFKRHRKNIYVAVVLAYLAYTSFESVSTVLQNPTLYDILGVDRPVYKSAPWSLYTNQVSATGGVSQDDGFDVKAARSNYRKLSLLYHPDKAQEGEEERAELMYRAVREAYEILTNPSTRHAYDRFGPIALSHCAHLTPSCKTESDYLWRAAFPMFWGHHVAQTAFLVLMWFIAPGNGSPANPTSGRRASYWRVLLYVAGVVLEARVVFGPPRLPAVIRLIPGTSRIPIYSLAAITRNLSTTTFVGSSHVLSALFAFAPAADMHVLLSAFDAFARALRDEAGKGFRDGFGPFRRVQDKERREELIGAVKKRMEKVGFEERIVALSPEVREVAARVRARVVGGVRKGAAAGGAGGAAGGEAGPGKKKNN
ncbi:hypothetical protein M427DRAFT_161162 [Gonapodya prolifera JEL478]|uniref:J domain-containing protein n=1 Tax=Gonapodya prolifera (strain JEL478) TaxID=1344416 RepID=A0A138ZX33_GONPJ|nr:hypothetical protein M427DRAFT_161162 [Gonapodya prolifera JEL478]|eukprot:KXS09070.1 hypothetical protein M427DRAFT_161162 [Gonapodya prolifera JEL478]